MWSIRKLVITSSCLAGLTRGESVALLMLATIWLVAAYFGFMRP